MKIAVGSDHAGFEDPPPHYKPAIIEHLNDLGLEVIDCGPDGPGSVDYPDYAEKVCEYVASGEADYGVLLCGTGMGISMAANRIQGIRAAVCLRPEMAWLTREHNNANVICLGKRLLTLRESLNLIDIFLRTPFDGGERHQRRVNKIDQIGCHDTADA